MNPSPRVEVVTGVTCTLLTTVSTGLFFSGHALLEAGIAAGMIPFSVAAIIRGLVRLEKEKSE
jgi:hypothetical protein